MLMKRGIYLSLSASGPPFGGEWKPSADQIVFAIPVTAFQIAPAPEVIPFTNMDMKFCPDCCAPEPRLVNQPWIWFHNDVRGPEIYLFHIPAKIAETAAHMDEPRASTLFHCEVSQHRAPVHLPCSINPACL